VLDVTVDAALLSVTVDAALLSVTVTDTGNLAVVVS